MRIDKKNGNVAFNEEFHKYWDLKDPNKVYTSVTTIIHSYTEPFDDEFWSRFKGLEQMLGAEEFKNTSIRKLLIT